MDSDHGGRANKAEVTSLLRHRGVPRHAMPPDFGLPMKNISLAQSYQRQYDVRLSGTDVAAGNALTVLGDSSAFDSDEPLEERGSHGDGATS